jgi:hypothetical protein
MGSQDHRRAAMACEGELLEQAQALLGIQASERLVEEKQRRLRDEGGRERDPMLLAVTEREGRASREVRCFASSQRLTHARLSPRS